jgi:hypothetical protein
MVEPDCVTDDFGWEPVTLVGIHHPIINQRRLSCQYHRRPLIHRIDALEDERQELELRLSDLEKAEKPAILSMNEADLQEFAEEWRSNLEGGTMDKRNAVFRQIIDSAEFDGEELKIAPNLTTLTGTGVKVASPRGFEPLLPP